MKLSKTQQRLLDALEGGREAIANSYKDFQWRIPWNSQVVPALSVYGRREIEAAKGLVAMGLLVQVSRNRFTTVWKETENA